MASPEIHQELVPGWEKVGAIGVDAGLCWFGDPCYILGDEPKSLPFKDWDDFCEQNGQKEKKGVALYGTDGGLGIATSTGYGDGRYDVFVRRSKGTFGNRISAVKVVFIPDPNDPQENEEGTPEPSWKEPL